ncbi:hypothetical protein X777_01824 [Ooceraea biroi]|uniref:Uncharacterized protein n=1 Tax=Ooceraea biroi TaxID=2015173 RepID=A0A026WMR8_OOCBI|nr:hypothetical protein X777_01824 [Ooceraea biroi]
MIIDKVYPELFREPFRYWWDLYKSGRENPTIDYDAIITSNINIDMFIEQIRAFITANSENALTVTMLAAQFEESPAIIDYLLPELRKNNIYNRLMPHNLNIEEQPRYDHCNDIIEISKENPEFLNLIVCGGTDWFFKQNYKLLHDPGENRR